MEVAVQYVLLGMLNVKIYLFLRLAAGLAPRKKGSWYSRGQVHDNETFAIMVFHRQPAALAKTSFC